MTSASNDAQSDTFDLKGFRGKLPQPPVFPTKLEERDYLKFRLAQAFRIFGSVAGHTAALQFGIEHPFWVNPFGLHFKLIQPFDLLLVDHKGEIQDESGQKNGPFRILNTAAFMIHAAIHAARPDGKAFSALGRTLDPISQDACAFYNDHVLYQQYNGIVLDDVEGSCIAAALGTKKAAILQNHGLLVATSSIEATVHFYIALERACQVQLLADTAAAAHGGKTVHINPTQAAVTGRGIGSRGAGWFTGNTEFMVLEREEGVMFKSSA
ncbi:class II aldolase/adducin domain-containing protein [Mycena pura]|uniref:Class II aldolase/adducin domain-containing protein n=1 Tax=Mycena pura TaxID=153505 RepID=A0AAD6VBP9_9AGAR|nr:class II aldolase/adducin domain-containing protein [Mycena pura]